MIASTWPCVCPAGVVLNASNIGQLPRSSAHIQTWQAWQTPLGSMWHIHCGTFMNTGVHDSFMKWPFLISCKLSWDHGSLSEQLSRTTSERQANIAPQDAHAVRTGAWIPPTGSPCCRSCVTVVTPERQVAPQGTNTPTQPPARSTDQHAHTAAHASNRPRNSHCLTVCGNTCGFGDNTVPYTVLCCIRIHKLQLRQAHAAPQAGFGAREATISWHDA